MVPRHAEKTLRRLAKGFPVIILTGPRQSGKSTLARSVFKDKPYAALEDPDVRRFAQEDPRGFLAQFPDGAVLDEVQRCPDLLSYIQTLVDKDRRAGLFVLTGSQQLLLLERVTQTLAGRAAIVTLLPFCLAELASAGRAPSSLDALLFSGLYPPLHDRDLDAGPWLSSYLATYVERDLRSILGVRDLDSFQRFVRLCAGRSGQLLNLSSLGADSGVTHNTARAWISVLQASHLVHLLPPHHSNFRKRIVKTPKLYLTDTGLVCSLLGIQSAAQVATHPLRGAIFETWVAGELLKARCNQGLRPNLYFWRDSAGLEVDFLAEDGPRLCPLEVKSGATVAQDAFASLDAWRRLAGKAAGPATLLHGGADRHARQGISVLPWTALGEHPLPVPGLAP